MGSSAVFVLLGRLDFSVRSFAKELPRLVIQAAF